MLCHGVLPVVAFLLAGGTVFWLMTKQDVATGMTGELFARRTDILVQTAGTLIDVPGRRISEFTPVRKGDVIAQLDPAPLQARLKAIEADFAAAKAELESTVATQEFEEAQAAGGLAGDAGQLEGELARLKVELAQTAGLLSIAETSKRMGRKQLDILQPLVKKKILPEYQMIEVEKLYEEAVTTAQAHTTTRTAILGQIAVIEKRLKSLPKVPTASIDALLAPIKKQMEAQTALAEEVRVQMEYLTIRAPFDGMITTVWLHPGQNVQTGTPVFTLAATESPYVLAYVRPTQHLRPEIGMGADVKFNAGGQTVDGRIVRIGAEVTDVSLKQLFDPRISEWGLPIAIQLKYPPGVKEKLHPRPGELVHVRLRPADIDANVAVASDVDFGPGALVLSPRNEVREVRR
jgi:membrane fusion protein (multidrug efflux system)